MDAINFKECIKGIKNGSVESLNHLLKEINDEEIEFSQLWEKLKKEISPNKFLQLLFKRKEPSQKILLFFYTQEQEALTSFIKESKGRLQEEHLLNVFSLYKEKEHFLKELKFWSGLWKEMDLEIEGHNSYMSKHSFEDLLILCGMYYEKLRISEGITRNEDHSEIEIINEILSHKLLLLKRDGQRLKIGMPLKLFFRRGMDILGQLATDDQEINKLFMTFQKRCILNFIYEKYCRLNFVVSFFNEKTANLKPADEIEYLQYRNIGPRYQYWQTYQYNEAAFDLSDSLGKINESPQSWYNKIGEANTQANLYQYLVKNFPKEIECKDGYKLDIFSCFRILNSLSGWSNLRWNNFIEKHILSAAQSPYLAIGEVIARNHVAKNDALPVLSRKFESLAGTAEAICKTPKGSGAHSLSLLTHNLSDGDITHIALNEKPFIQVGANIYWFAGILSNKNYTVMIQDLLLREDTTNSEDGVTKTHSKYQEDEVAYWFEKNDFKILKNYQFKNGEIDLLAFKNDTLFICEIKATFFRASVREIQAHHVNKSAGIGKAIQQLEKDIGYVKENWERLKVILDVSNSIETIRIVPLAVTSTLETGSGKIEIKGVKGHIVSSFELIVILRNRKYFLYNIPEAALSIKYNGNIPLKYMEVLMAMKDDEVISKEIATIASNFANENAGKLNFSLWQEGNVLCSAKDIISALENDSIWDFIKKNESLSMKNLFVADYTLNYFE